MVGFARAFSTTARNTWGEWAAFLILAVIAMPLIHRWEEVMMQSLDSPVPSDDEIRKILVERIDSFHQGVGIVVGVIDAHGRRALSYGSDMLTILAANLGYVKSPLAPAMASRLSVRRPTGTLQGGEIGLTWLIRKTSEDETVWHNGGTGAYRSFLG
jgi:hypothetical protein